MASVTKSIKLDLPPDRAFALATDPARFEEWLSLHAGWPEGPPAGMSAGDAFAQTLKLMGVPVDVSWTVAELTDSKAVMHGSGPMGAELTTTITAVPDGEATMVSYEAEVSGPGTDGAMGDMATEKAADEVAVSLEKLRELAA